MEETIFFKQHASRFMHIFMKKIKVAFKSILVFHEFSSKGTSFNNQAYEKVIHYMYLYLSVFKTCSYVSLQCLIHLDTSTILFANLNDYVYLTIKKNILFYQPLSNGGKVLYNALLDCVNL
jgi:hypothetical protein